VSPNATASPRKENILRREIASDFSIMSNLLDLYILPCPVGIRRSAQA
jgi:hypothetical protein